jgi:hypothetical protein
VERRPPRRRIDRARSLELDIAVQRRITDAARGAAWQSVSQFFSERTAPPPRALLSRTGCATIFESVALHQTKFVSQ